MLPALPPPSQHLPHCLDLGLPAALLPDLLTSCDFLGAPEGAPGTPPATPTDLPGGTGTVAAKGTRAGTAWDQEATVRDPLDFASHPGNLGAVLL